MKKSIWVSILLFFVVGCIGQTKTPLKLKAAYKDKNNPDTIRLTLRNLSDTTYYYAIGLQGLTQSGWEGLRGDISTLGRKDVLGLRPLKAKSTIVKYVSRKYIDHLYQFRHLKKIRFGVTYSNKNDVDAKYQEIILPPM